MMNAGHAGSILDEDGNHDEESCQKRPRPAPVCRLRGGADARLRRGGARRELFVDRFLIESLDGARLRLHEPIPAETVLRGGPEHPWEGAGSTAVAVWKDGDRFRMHYRCIATKDFQAGKFQPEWAIAESRDGIHWTRPLRDARALAFGRLSNLVADDQGRPLPSMTSIALNARPGAPADQRYIGLNILRPRGDMAYSTATLYTSPDGFRWTRFREEPVYETDLYNAFDSQPMIFWSEAEGQYVMLHRYLIQGEQAGADSLPGMRSVARTTSPDLMTWSEPVKMSYDELGRLDPYVNFYTNGTQPCPGAPHLYVALYARLMPGRKVITESQALGLDLPTWNQFRYDVECSDSALMTARVEEPTLYRQTFKETFIRPGFGPQHWTSRSNFALAGVLETGPAEWSVYVNRGYLQTDWRVQRLTIRRDGFASVRAPWAGGEMITRPLVFEGSFLTVNHANGAPGEIRVELQDEDGAPIPGFELNACDPIYGDNVERGVTVRAARRGSLCDAVPGRAARAGRLRAGTTRPNPRRARARRARRRDDGRGLPERRRAGRRPVGRPGDEQIQSSGRRRRPGMGNPTAARRPGSLSDEPGERGRRRS